MFMASPSGFVSLIRRFDSKGIIHDFIDTATPKYREAISKSKYKGLVQKGAIATITQFSDIVFDPNGNLFTSDRLNHQIRKIDTEGNVSTIAGTGDSDHYGDNGPALEAAFRDPNALASDSEGNIYIADTANNMIRKIDIKGIITTFAGNGEHADSGDGGPALKAGIRSMDDIEFSPEGELHILGTNTHKVRKITKGGEIITVAGKGYGGFFGDGGSATKAMLKNPAAISFDSKGNMYIADMGNNRIRKVDGQGIITTFAGTGSFGWGRTGETVEIYLQNFP
jgi:sugar lactone lactonase YvrE